MLNCKYKMKLQMYMIKNLYDNTLPYYTPFVADGLAFSCQIDGYIPPSLENIFKEIDNNFKNNNYPNSNEERTGNLTHWAKQGVFLFNTALTVEAAMPESHLKAWKPFTERILSELNEKEPIVFMLWGNKSQVFEKYITNKNHLILKSAHPSPLSVSRGFFGCEHFSKANEFLNGIYGKERTIRW